jgi:hypothetical protein
MWRTCREVYKRDQTAHHSRIFAPSLVMLAVLLGTACDRQDPTNLVVPTARLSTEAAPVTDDVMGSLSPVAQYIVAALQDSGVRFRLAAVMKNPNFPASIVDLQDCAGGQGSLVWDLLDAGERRHLGSAVSICEKLRKRVGITLYMSPERAAAWNPRTIPIVTAVETATGRRAGSFKGYLSPSRTIDLPDDGKIAGPILVVLGSPHPNRLMTLKPTLFSLDVRNAIATRAPRNKDAP